MLYNVAEFAKKRCRIRYAITSNQFCAGGIRLAHVNIHVEGNYIPTYLNFTSRQNSSMFLELIGF